MRQEQQVGEVARDTASAWTEIGSEHELTRYAHCSDIHLLSCRPSNFYVAGQYH